MLREAYCDLHALAADQLHAAHHVLLHLDQLRQLAGELGAPLAGGLLAEGMSWAGLAVRTELMRNE
jgi:hypothetical protein